MSDTLEPLILDLLEWIGPDGRPYAEVLAAWRTSCPRLPVWEEANERGYVDEVRGAGAEVRVAVTELGVRLLAERRGVVFGTQQPAESFMARDQNTLRKLSE